MTNNPKKVEFLINNGITVKERVPLIVSTNPNNENYLKTKAKKSGHILWPYFLEPKIAVPTRTNVAP